MRNINKIIIHCSVSSFGSSSVIDRWHRERGWSGIGYHYVICNGYENSNDEFEETVLNGEVQVGRDIEKTGAHCKGQNTGSIGVCMIGTSTFTDEQFTSLGALVMGMIEQFDLKPENVYGHYDYSQKTCPNFDVKEFMNKYVLSETTI